MQMEFLDCGSETGSSQLDEIKNGVKSEIGVDGEEVENERVGRLDECCLKFAVGSAVCFIY